MKGVHREDLVQSTNSSKKLRHNERAGCKRESETERRSFHYLFYSFRMQGVHAITGRGSRRDLFGRSVPLFSALQVEIRGENTTHIDILVNIHRRSGALDTSRSEVDDFLVLIIPGHQRIFFHIVFSVLLIFFSRTYSSVSSCTDI